SEIASASAKDAVLTTYSAATSARAAMAVAGWYIARAPGALGKREMTVASKNPDKLSHLKRVDEERLARRFHDGDFE
ncbi:MAG: MnmC family methyltransferase, partial [Desulfobacteraceae bacterium]